MATHVGQRRKGRATTRSTKEELRTQVDTTQKPVLDQSSAMSINARSGRSRSTRNATGRTGGGLGRLVVGLLHKRVVGTAGYERLRDESLCLWEEKESG